MECYSNLLHECTHSTAPHLHRDTGGRFGDAKYAKEELVAELSAALVGNALGFDKRILDNNAAYVDGWLDALSQEPQFIISVMSDVGKASNLIMEKVDEQLLSLGQEPLLQKNRTDAPQEQQSVSVSLDAVCEGKASKAMPPSTPGQEPVSRSSSEEPKVFYQHLGFVADTPWNRKTFEELDKNRTFLEYAQKIDHLKEPDLGKVFSELNSWYHNDYKHENLLQQDDRHAATLLVSGGASGSLHPGQMMDYVFYRKFTEQELRDAVLKSEECPKNLDPAINDWYKQLWSEKQQEARKADTLQPLVITEGSVFKKRDGTYAVRAFYEGQSLGVKPLGREAAEQYLAMKDGPLKDKTLHAILDAKYTLDASHLGQDRKDGLKR